MKSVPLSGALCVACLLFSATPGLAQMEQKYETVTLRLATDQAVSQAADQLAHTNFQGVKKVAVVPLRGDNDGYATTTLKSAITRTPYELFARDDAEWNDLLREIQWGVQREDVMDAETVKRFGRIKGVDAIMFGTIWDRSTNMWGTRGRVKLTVYLGEVETGRILWSSGPVESDAYIHWSDAVTQFWRYPALLMVVIGVVFLFLVFAFILRRSFRPL